MIFILICSFGFLSFWETSGCFIIVIPNIHFQRLCADIILMLSVCLGNSQTQSPPMDQQQGFCRSRLHLRDMSDKFFIYNIPDLIK